jgi:putative membrane protein
VPKRRTAPRRDRSARRAELRGRLRAARWYRGGEPDEDDRARPPRGVARGSSLGQYDEVVKHRPDWWPAEGREPDATWSLANERTVLAYTRTALAFVVAGLAVAGSRRIADTPWWLAMLGIPLLLIGAGVGLAGGRRFLAVQRTMRTGEPLGAPVVAALLPVLIAVIAAVGCVLATVAVFAGPG